MKINKKLLMQSDYPERLGRLCMAADFYLKYQDNKNISKIAKTQLSQQVELVKMWFELKDKEK